MNNVITITRKTRKLGWGYTCWTKAGDTPSKPDITGTVKQIFDGMADDRTYQSLKSGGTYIAEQWFYDGKPIHFSGDSILSLDYLLFGLIDFDFGGEPVFDSVDVTLDR